MIGKKQDTLNDVFHNGINETLLLTFNTFPVGVSNHSSIETMIIHSFVDTCISQGLLEIIFRDHTKT